MKHMYSNWVVQITFPTGLVINLPFMATFQYGLYDAIMQWLEFEDIVNVAIGESFPIDEWD